MIKVYYNADKSQTDRLRRIMLSRIDSSIFQFREIMSRILDFLERG